MKPQEIIALMQQALQDGDTYVIVQRGSYTQVGLRSSDGKQTVNITAAVVEAFSLPHHGKCIVGSESQVRDLLPAKKMQPVVSPAPVKRARVTVQDSVIPDFDNMSAEETVAWIIAHPDDIQANKEKWA